MRERSVWRGRGLVAAAGVVALLAIAGVPAAAGAASSLAFGSVTEIVPPGPGSDGNPWNITFDLNRKPVSSSVDVKSSYATFSFNASRCSGSFTDPKLKGTTVYGVGQITSAYSGNSAFNTTYYAFSIHKSSSGAADYSRVWGVGAYWSIYCSIPTLLSPTYKVSSGSVTWGV